jgi:hypothetical protein
MLSPLLAVIRPGLVSQPKIGCVAHQQPVGGSIVAIHVVGKALMGNTDS